MKSMGDDNVRPLDGGDKNSRDPAGPHAGGQKRFSVQFLASAVASRVLILRSERRPSAIFANVIHRSVRQFSVCECPPDLSARHEVFDLIS